MQDITAWVDFTRVAEAALACGLDVSGFCTQAAFLLATGVEQLLAESTDTVEHARLAGQARRLLLPGEMGEAFKAMALTLGILKWRWTDSRYRICDSRCESRPQRSKLRAGLALEADGGAGLAQSSVSRAAFGFRASSRAAS